MATDVPNLERRVQRLERVVVLAALLGAMLLTSVLF